MLESAYESCLTFELMDRGLSIERQKALPVVYRGVQMDCAYRLDILVGRDVIVEVKAVERIGRLHEAQMLSYLKLSGCKVGLLFNFNVRWLVDEGIKRFVNGFPEQERH